MTDTFLCPRRAEDGLTGNHPFKVPATDSWRAPTKTSPHRTCSYCGSLHPEDFLVAALNCHVVTPTDKNYKAYIDLPHPDPEGLRLISVTDQPYEGYVEVTAEELKENGWSDRPGKAYGRWSKNGPIDTAKFYFQHFSPEHAQKFIELMNARHIKLAEPGHFYVMPFFMQRLPKPDQQGG